MIKKIKIFKYGFDEDCNIFIVNNMLFEQFTNLPLVIKNYDEEDKKEKIVGHVQGGYELIGEELYANVCFKNDDNYEYYGYTLEVDITEFADSGIPYLTVYKPLEIQVKECTKNEKTSICH